MSFDFESLRDMDFLDDISVWDEVCEELLQDFEAKEDVSESSAHEMPSEEILKKYPTYVENGINAHSFAMLLESIRKFSTEDFTSICYFPKGNPNSHSYRELKGLSVTADFLHKNFSTAPDSIFLVHNTHISHEADGTVVITAKFTCNGTRLHVLTSYQNDGIENPQAPSATVLLNTIKKIHPNSNHENIEQFYDSVDAARQPIMLRKKESKFNRYKNETAHTLGAHFEYSTFSESSLQNNKKKHDEIDDDELPTVERSNTKFKTDNGNSAEIHIKSYNNSNTVAQSAQSPSSKNNMTKEQTLVSKLTSKISSKFSADEIMIADDRTSFGFSALLPVPISYEVYGIMKFYLNSEGKAFCMEVPLAGKEAKIPTK